MAGIDSNEETEQARILRRLEAMGVRARLVPGGRCILASMQATTRSLETLNGTLLLNEIVFATVGRNHIKCLRPQALFVLPLIRILDCNNITTLEGRIHAAWARHMKDLQSAESWLRDVGADFNAGASGAVLNVSLNSEGKSVKAQVTQPRKVILPSHGPLSGVTLLRAEDRVMDIDPCVDSGVDLEIDIANRFEELASLDKRLKEDVRRSAMARAVPSFAPTPQAAERGFRILLVGEHLSKERSCIDSLRLRNYEVATARSLKEAIELYDRISPELIMADVSLGRSEGIELIPSLRSVVGIEEIPVILVDHHRRGARRQAAQQAGAIGYLTYPIDISRIADQLEATIKKPKRRRFTRYTQQLAIRIEGSTMASTAIVIGRGGIMIRTDERFALNSVRSCDLSLPAVGKHLEFEAEVLYKVNTPGSSGVGVRFQDMPAAHETELINYLHCLH